MRDLASVDLDINCERAILLMELRAGTDRNAVHHCRARIDQLLEERHHLTTSDDCDSEVTA